MLIVINMVYGKKLQNNIYENNVKEVMKMSEGPSANPELRMNKNIFQKGEAKLHSFLMYFYPFL